MNTGERELVGVLRQHLPRDRYDDEGHSAGTYCTCGGWSGDYFADGEAGPFDDHLAAAIEGWLAERPIAAPTPAQPDPGAAEGVSS